MDHVHSRGRAAMVCFCLVAIALLAPGVPLAGRSSALPPDSAYEKVTPEDKGDGDAWYQTSTLQASRDGARVKYQSAAAFGEDQANMLPTDHLAVRGDDGWGSRAIMLPYEDIVGINFDAFRIGYQIVGDDLRSGVALAGLERDTTLAPGASRGMRNLYARDFDSGAYSLLSPPPLTVPRPAAGVQISYAAAAATPDGGHVAFENPLQLVRDALPASSFCTDFGFFGCVTQAYEWDNGRIRLVGVLPDGRPAPGGSVVGAGAGTVPFPSLVGWMRATSDAVSTDGSRILFTTPAGSAGGLYVREDGSTSIRVDREQRPGRGPDPEGDLPSQFLGASDDLNTVLFRSCEKLTDDSTAQKGAASGCDTSAGLKQDLYKYDLASGILQDLTHDLGVDFRDPIIIGGDSEMSRMYVGSAAARQIYLIEAGGMRLVADRVGEFSNFGERIVDSKQTTVSSDGRFLVFQTATPQGPEDTGGRPQLHIYDAETGETRCISCPARGGATDGAVLRPLEGGVPTVRAYETRNIDSGNRRVFFETPDPLLLEDVNGRVDVYQYAIDTQRVALVSTGQGDHDAHFGDASSDGNSVFVVTRSRLIPALDGDELQDIYVARVGATPYRHTRRLPCAGDACQGALPAPRSFLEPGTVGFEAPETGDEAAVETERVFSVNAIGRRQQVRWARLGRTTLRVRVSDAGKVSARVRARVGKRTRVVARSTRKARRGGTVRMKLRLARVARRHLRRTGRLRVAVVVRYERGGAPQRARLTLRVRARRGAGNGVIR